MCSEFCVGESQCASTCGSSEQAINEHFEQLHHKTEGKAYGQRECHRHPPSTGLCARRSAYTHMHIRAYTYTHAHTRVRPLTHLNCRLPWWHHGWRHAPCMCSSGRWLAPVNVAQQVAPAANEVVIGKLPAVWVDLPEALWHVEEAAVHVHSALRQGVCTRVSACTGAHVRPQTRPRAHMVAQCELRRHNRG